MSLPTLSSKSFSATHTLGQLMTVHTLTWLREGLLRLRRNPMHPFLLDDVIVYIVVIITVSNSHTWPADDFAQWTFLRSALIFIEVVF